MQNTYADVIISINVATLDKIFQYKIPAELMQKAKVGKRVSVPFGYGNRSETGYIIGIGQHLLWEEDKVKSIKEVLDEEEAISEEFILLAKWMKDRYLATLSSCLQTIIPKQLINAERYLEITDYATIEKVLETVKKRGYKRQYELLYYLYCNGITNVKNLRGITPASVISSLLKKGIIRYSEPLREEGDDEEFLLEEPLTLGSEQQKVYNKIVSSIWKDKFSQYLLQGVTGSGKTEVYMQLIEEAIRRGKEAIVLVPEISLTPQMVHKFKSRFGNLVGVTHSRLNQTERLGVWKKARDGHIKVVLGPRSAIFAPFNHLGIIIIDEEHELSYKSETHPKYNAIEVARKRCEMQKGVLLLGSATPSVNTFYEAAIGKMNYLAMQNRVAGAMPKVKLVDMRIELENGNKNIFSRSLHDAIGNRLEKGQQIILFLNRRGHSTFVSCRSCGFVLKCPNCDLPYTYHRSDHKMQCHHCGAKVQIHEKCPSCQSKYIKYFGVGTQKIEFLIEKAFPTARILRMDLDTTTKKNAHERYYHEFKEGKADILIGTQMIAKGLDFPNVTLVGVIAADMSLYSSDFRAAERTFQLLTQVAGRAGRNKYPGEVIIQTYSPENYAVQAALYQDYDLFYQQEILFRENMDYPPFTNILTFLIQHQVEKHVIESIHTLYNILQYYGAPKGFEIIGPAPANLSKLKNNYRWHIIVKHKDYERLKNYAEYCMKVFYKYNKSVTLLYDLNPLIIQ